MMENEERSEKKRLKNRSDIFLFLYSNEVTILLGINFDKRILYITYYSKLKDKLLEMCAKAAPIQIIHIEIQPYVQIIIDFLIDLTKSLCMEMTQVIVYNTWSLLDVRLLFKLSTTYCFFIL